MRVREIYEGSDGEATKALYEQLAQLGPAGVVAVNLFRAQKCSARAKVYRGGDGRRSYKNLAYDRKNWSMKNLTEVLQQHGAELEIRWGWQADPETVGFPWVLYVEIPTGQCSFHNANRGQGPEYSEHWDGLRNRTHHRIIEWCEQLLSLKPVEAK